jgi:hypothetical protein
MSTTDVRNDGTGDAGAPRADMKLETVVVPVSAADRARGRRLARLVRGVHGGGAVRSRASVVSDHAATGR